jgi:hypothetical protein
MASQTASENSALLGRLEKLESENRRMKQIGALVLVAIAALILMGQASKNRALDADSLVLRDPSGRVRMEFGTGDDDAPILRMFGGSDNKTPSLSLRSAQKGSGLWFFGGGGVMMLSNIDSPTLTLADGMGGTAVDVASVHVYDSDNFAAALGRMDTVNKHQEWGHYEDICGIINSVWQGWQVHLPGSVTRAYELVNPARAAKFSMVPRSGNSV